MNLELFCKDLLKELKVDASNMHIQTKQPLSIRLLLDKHLNVELKEQEIGLLVSAPLCQIEAEEIEEVYALLLEANLFGQGTGTFGVLGLTKDGKMLLLNLDIDFDLTYVQFKERMEDFLNYIEYWQKKIELTLEETKS
ncbi:MAG: hypothetical protein K940chlam8_00151 [Chlamydiae bacterium]|nr:hypothetical protein [Chlamydiota bacterium]